MRISLIINIQIYKLIMLITVYIVLLLLDKLIDMGCAGGAISPLRSSRKERKQEGGYTVASSKTRGETPTRSNFLP